MKRNLILLVLILKGSLFLLITYIEFNNINNIDEDSSSSASTPTFYDVTATNPVHLPMEMLRRWNETFYGGVDNYIRYSTARLGLEELESCRPMRSDFGPVIHDVTSFRFPINVPACADALQVFIVVISAPGYFKKRHIVRQTWGRHLDISKARVGFLVGKTKNRKIQSKIEEESHAYGDIIQVDIKDAYKSLPLKTVAYLSWVNKFCQKVPFILKIDDDVFINVYNLATILHSLPPNKPAIYGGYNPTEFANRDKNSEWYVSFEVWPWYNYPPYLYGGSYLISRAAIEPLLAAAQVTPYFIFEDVYLIGLCARKANVLVLSNYRIFILEETMKCSYNPFCAFKQVAWLTGSYEDMLTSNRQVEKFYQIKNNDPPNFDYALQTDSQETTLYRLH